MTALPLVHFLEEQRRHRRTSALSAAVVVVVLAVSGIPLSVLVSPFLVAAAAVPVYLADLVFDIPEAVTGWLDRTFNLLPTMWSAARRADVDMPWDWLAVLFARRARTTWPSSGWPTWCRRWRWPPGCRHHVWC
jgi:hypothetical protein